MNRCLHIAAPLGVAPQFIAACPVSTMVKGVFALGFALATVHAAHAQSGAVLAAPEGEVVQAAEGGRQFPAKALRGTMQMLQAPELLIDGKRERLSPGARVLGPTNTLVTPASIIGQEITVNFVRDGYGLVHQVWLLTREEARQKTARNTAARNFQFGSEAQAAKADDGNTPYNQLPKYGK